MFTRGNKRIRDYLESNESDTQNGIGYFPFLRNLFTVFVTQFFISLDEQCSETNSEPSVKKHKSLPKILDGKYFVLESEENGKLIVTCTVCNEQKKGNASSTGNFLKHYRKKHHDKVKELEEYLKSREENVKAIGPRQTVLDVILNQGKETNVCNTL